MTQTTQVFIALGTNLGDRRANLEAGIEKLGRFVNVTQRSRLYESAPMYVTDQPAFLNMAVGGTTVLAPEDLLSALKDLEEEIGREPTFRNGPRLIDLDILYYDDRLMDTDTLNLPHPRIGERGFVLFPMNDMAPDWQDVRTGRTVAQMVADMGPDDSVVVVE